jgi:hypothetical protein
VNLDKHLLEQHATPAGLRKEIVQRFAHYKRTDSSVVKLSQQPAHLIQELGTPLAGLCCKTCRFLTVSTSVIRIHLKKSYQQAWKGEKSELLAHVQVQSFFRLGGLQKYFIVEGGNVENGQNVDQNQVVMRQLDAWHKVREQLGEDMQVMDDAAKADKTG